MKVLYLILEIDKEANTNDIEIPDEIKAILDERKQARDNKDYGKSDELRDLLKAKGYIVKDSKEGQKIERA